MTDIDLASLFYENSIVLLASAAGATCGTLTGFGITLSFLMVYSLLGPFLPPLAGRMLVPWAFNVVGVLTCVATAIELRRRVPIRWVAHLIVPTILASPGGTLVSLSMETDSLMLVFSGVFFVVASQQLWREWDRERQRSAGDEEKETPRREGDPPRDLRERAELVCAGTASGFLGGLCGLGGPPLQTYVVARPLRDPLEMRAGASAYFTFIYLANLTTLTVASPRGTLADSALHATLAAAALGVLLGRLLGAALLRLGSINMRMLTHGIIGLLFISCAAIWANAAAAALAPAEPAAPEGAAGHGAASAGGASPLMPAGLRLLFLAATAAWVALLRGVFLTAAGQQQQQGKSAAMV